jgi:hypothetical protein
MSGDIYTSTPAIRLRGMERNKFTFLPLSIRQFRTDLLFTHPSTINLKTRTIEL